MKKHGLLLAALSALPLIASAGCAESENGYVYYINFKPEADSAWQRLATDYTEQTGVPVKVVTAASGSYTGTLSSQMNKSSPPTLFVVNNSQDILNWDDYCFDLKGSRLADMLDSDEYCIFGNNGEIKAVGYCYEAFGIIVNKELLGRAGYDISDIYNFDSLKAAAEDIHSRSGELGFDAFTSCGLDDSSAWRFTGHLANMPLFYEFRDDNVLEQPAAIKGSYLDKYRNIWDLYINNSTVSRSEITYATGNLAEEEFGSGKAVFFQNGTWEFEALTSGEKYGMEPDSLTMIPIYCGAEGEEKAGLCCGTENYWAVNSRAGQKNIDATIDFLCWVVSSDEGRQMMADSFGETPFKEHIESDNVFFKAASEYEEKGCYTVTWQFRHTPNTDAWRAGIKSALTDYSCAGGSWDNVERAFIDGWAYQYKLEHCIFD